MPSHQERRDPLPSGYQFGDAGPATDLFDLASKRLALGKSLDREYVDSPERLRLVAAKHWNDLERGEH